jgi:hypothetical protein
LPEEHTPVRVVLLTNMNIPYRTFRKHFLTPDEGLGAYFLVVSSKLRCICT